MDDKSEGITLLFHKLCELSFLSEASKREDAYTRIHYTKARRHKVQTALYEKLFGELQAPWTGGRSSCVTKNKKDEIARLNPYEKIAVTVFQLRLARQFDKADLLEYYTAKWRAIPGTLSGSLDLKSPRNHISEPDAILEFIVALSGTGLLQTQPLLEHQDEPFTNNMQFKDFKSHLPEGPLLNTDSLKLKTEALLAEHYVQYSSALFERLPTIAQDNPTQNPGPQMFTQIIGPGQGRNRFFALQEAGEAPHDKKTRQTVFGALSHGHTEDMQVKLGLPELPSSPHERTFGLSTLPTAESPDDEGFHELPESSITSQRMSGFYPSLGAVGEDIWRAALALPPQRVYTWEMEGRRDGLIEHPYITEAGPAVFDELYNVVSRQLSYLVKTPSNYTMVSLTMLVTHSLDVVIGVPSATFLSNNESLGFTVNSDVRLSGCSPELIQNVLSKLAAVGTDYVRLVRFIHIESQSGGLVLQAFLGGLSNYLQCYRATVLSVNASSVRSPFQLNFTFQSLGKQLRFLSNMCLCSKKARPPTSSKQPFPAGVKLLSYLYKLATDHSSSEHYPVLLSLLKHSCAPYIMFVQQWVFQGKCIDLYGEFIIELDDQFLAYRDKHFWSQGFVIAEKDKLECVPLFLSELANDIFVCGKSINLLKLCYPDHFLCDSGVLPPKMEVTFSMSKLKAIDQNCLLYIDSMDAMARKSKEQRERKKLAIEKAKEKALVEEKRRAEKALAEITEMIEKVKEAISAKKKEDLQMLKKQMEDAMKQKEIVREKERDEDRKYMEEAMHRFDEEDGIRERARQELIEYYQKLTEEMDRREERAQWNIKRHELNKSRFEFFAREQAKLEQLIKQTSQDSNNLPSPEAQSNQDGYTTAISAVSLASTATKGGTSSTPSPSLVSLIASGVKTDALVQSRTRKSMNQPTDDTSDSGFIPGTGTAFPGSGAKEDDDHTIRSIPPLDHDDYDETDTSEASSSLKDSGARGQGRKQWSSSQSTSSHEMKAESGAVASRRTWETKAGEVHLAESPFPHGHPSESSIQFAMYSDKKSDGMTTDAKSTPPILPAFPNPSDSKLQSIIYPEAGQGLAIPNTDSTKHKDNEEAEEFPKESTASKDIDPVIQDFLQSLSTDVTRSRAVLQTKSPHGHPTQSTAQDILYPVKGTVYHPRERPQFGHPTDSSAQNLLYGVQESPSTPYGTPRSIHGHPTDSSAQSLLYGQQDTRTSSGTPRSSFGHPTDSSAQNLLYGQQDTRTASGTPRSTFGHPTDSSAQNLLYGQQDTPTASGTPRSAHGHPTDSSAQNLLYGQQDTPTVSGTPRSVHGHPTDSTAQEILYRGTEVAPHGHRSPYGHPSDSQFLDNPSVPSKNILAHKSRGQWGHPSDSKVQKLLGDISTLSDIGQSGTRGAPPVSVVQDILYPKTTRGTPPPESMKGVLYPGKEASVSGVKRTSTRGHEPAVTITKLMYPKEETKEMEPEPAKPLEFEDIWLASQVQPLQNNFDKLDQHPTTDLLKSVLGSLVVDQDEDEDIDAARLMSLPVLLRRSVTAPLTAQISLVNSAVVEYFMEELELQQHFEVFRKFLFMEDGEFSLSLSDQMFEKLSAGVTPREVCSPTVMNGIVTRALQLSVYADKTGYEQQLSFALKSMPDMFNLNDIGTLDFLELRYHVQWPVNIVITENSIIKYNKVFSFMLRLKRVAWVLREIWFHLKHIGFSRRAAGSPQLRQLQLFRHEMLHFLQNIEGYLSNQILNVTWVEFQQELATNVRNLDDLHHRHTEYLNKAIFRSLLSKKATPVMKIINDIFSLVLKFRTQLMSCPWQQDSAGGHVVHPRFEVMCATHRAFKEYSGFLFTVVSKLVRRGYQSHLQDFLLRLNFNDFYKIV